MKGPLGLLFFAHVLSSWGDRMWWFAGGIFMKDLAGFDHESLLFVGVYTLTTSGTILAFGACLGRWIDNTPRLKAIVVILILQNSLLTICAITIISMFLEWNYILMTWNGSLLRLLQAFVIITASFSQLASTGTQIIIQKDWIVVICDGDMHQLATFNSIFRTIDLTTQVVAPLAVGFVREQGSKLYSAVMIAVWNIISMIVEYYVFSAVYKKFPKLKQRVRKRQHNDNCSEKYADHTVCPTAENEFAWCCYCFRAFCYDWKTYFTHTIRFAGLGLALLYMTVLGFDAITTAYSDTQIPTYLVAAAQGGAALIGVLGSASFPWLRKCVQQETIGVIGLCLEIATLVLCVASVWLPGSPFDKHSLQPFHNIYSSTSRDVRHPDAKKSYVSDKTSIIVMCVGIVLSRYGLWLTDITVTQIMQERIEENKRGTINGVQDSLNMGMDMLKSCLVIAFPEPRQFGLLVILSFIFICCGLISYSIFMCHIKGLPSHMPLVPKAGDDETKTFQEDTDIREPYVHAPVTHSEREETGIHDFTSRTMEQEPEIPIEDVTGAKTQSNNTLLQETFPSEQGGPQ